MTPHPLAAAAAVGAGGFLGTLVRYAVALQAQRLSGPWPWGTLCVNVAGCLFIGILSHLRPAGLSPELRLFLTIGFCGGLTTLSSMVYETAALGRASGPAAGVAYLALTLVASFGAYVAGLRLAHATGRLAAIVSWTP